MAIFDAQIRRVAAYVDEMRALGRQVHEYRCPPTPAALTEGLPMHVGSGAHGGVILRAETHVELGNPQLGSCGLVLWTTDCSLVSDGRITAIGPDISQSAGASLPFGQILVVAGTELGPDDHPAVGQAQYVGDQIEGYMVRSSSRNLWGRVSTTVASKGFDFHCLGRALMAIYKSRLPKIEAMEVVFVTSDAADVAKLETIAGEVRDIGVELVNEHWKARGYELDCDLDCRACQEKDVCDDIRKVIAAKMRKEKSAVGKDEKHV